MLTYDNRKLILIGDSAFAEVAHEYFTWDSQYTVVAFAVERPYLKRTTLLSKDVVAFDELSSKFPAADHDVYVAVTYGQLNRLRTRLLVSLQAMGYRPATYVSSHAIVAKNVSIGQHCFIMENNVIQPFARIGDNVVLWSGNHIGHHSSIGNNVFVSSHVVVSGYSSIGSNTFLGVNTTIANNVAVGSDCWTGPNVTLMKDTNDGELYPGSQTEVSRVGARRFFRVRET